MNDEESLDICACFLKAEGYWTRDSNISALVLRCVFDTPELEHCLEITHPAAFAVRHRSNGPSNRDSLECYCCAVSGSHEFRFLKVGSTYWEIDHPYCREYTSDAIFIVSVRDIAALTRVYRAVGLNPTLPSLMPQSGFMSVMRDKISNRAADLIDAVFLGDWSDFRNSGYAWLIVGATFAGACYGGLHLTAWTNQFPSYAETVLWRAASITILATGPLLALANIIAAAIDSDLTVVEGGVDHKGKLVASVFAHLLNSIVLLLLLWYMLCRAFIVVECFILLAHIQESALRVPTWSAYIPSFS